MAGFQKESRFYVDKYIEFRYNKDQLNDSELKNYEYGIFDFKEFCNLTDWFCNIFSICFFVLYSLEKHRRRLSDCSD